MVAIKDFNMPESCNDCPMSIESGFCSFDCAILDKEIIATEHDFCYARLEDCPLVEINALRGNTDECI